MTEPYQMDPETDDLIYAYQLRKGMVILAERPSLVAGAQGVWNNWSTVHQIERDDTRIYFIGVLENGVKASYDCSPNIAWYVKKDSMPFKDPAYQECMFWSANCAGLIERIGTPEGFQLRLICTHHLPRLLTTDVALAQVKSVTETSAGLAVNLEPTDLGRKLIEPRTNLEKVQQRRTSWDSENLECIDKVIPNTVRPVPCEGIVARREIEFFPGGKQIASICTAHLDIRESRYPKNSDNVFNRVAETEEDRAREAADKDEYNQKD